MSVGQLPLETKIPITGTRLYGPIRNICLTHDAFSFASYALNKRPVPSLDGLQRGSAMSGNLPISVMIPFGITFSTGLFAQEEPPIWVMLKTREATEAASAKFDLSHSGNFSRVMQFLNDGAAAQFVMYYENHFPWVKAKASGTIGNLEPTWGFGRVVRNAIGHAGKIAIRDKNFAPVEWGGLKYGPSEDGRVLIGNDLHAPDLILLMLDMDRALDAMGYTPPA